MRVQILALAVASSAIPALAQSASSPLTGSWRLVALDADGGRAADLGDLKVEASGSYQWSENRKLAGLGSLMPHRPSSGARSKQDCWLFHRGKGDLYAFRNGEVLEIYDAASNALVGKGVKGGSRSR